MPRPGNSNRRANGGDGSGDECAVVIGLDCITGLQTARILHARGISVTGVASDPSHFCCRTGVVREVVGANTESEELIGALNRLASRLPERAVLVPCTDASVLQIARGRERLDERFRIVLPDTEVLLTLQDKIRFVRFAESIGLPVPQTFLLRSTDDVRTAAAALRFPCMLKPTVRTERWQRSSPAKVYRAASREELIELHARCSEWAEELIVQEWIEGGDSELFSCNCYLDRDSVPQVSFIARKLRQWPPRIGVSCLGEECRNDEVLDFAHRLFRAAGYQGLAYLEVKRDSGTGRHYLIEANLGRPTGRSAIAEAGGVDLLLTMYRDTLGEPLPTTRSQRYTGAKWIFWRQDLRSALHYWRNGELSVTDWIRSIRGRKACAVLSWADPAPFLWDLTTSLMRVLAPSRGASASTDPGESGSLAARTAESPVPAEPAPSAIADVTGTVVNSP